MAKLNANNEKVKDKANTRSVHISIFIERNVRYAITTPTKLIIAPMRPDTIAINASGEATLELEEKW